MEERKKAKTKHGTKFTYHDHEFSLLKIMKSNSNTNVLHRYRIGNPLGFSSDMNASGNKKVPLFPWG